VKTRSMVWEKGGNHNILGCPVEKGRVPGGHVEKQGGGVWVTPYKKWNGSHHLDGGRGTGPRQSHAKEISQKRV